MTIKLAHIRTQGIDFAVFAADATTHSNSARQKLLNDLIRAGRQNGLNIDKAALCYSVGRRTEYFGTADLVRYLSRSGVPRWTHSIQV